MNQKTSAAIDRCIWAAFLEFNKNRTFQFWRTSTQWVSLWQLCSLAQISGSWGTGKAKSNPTKRIEIYLIDLDLSHRMKNGLRHRHRGHLQPETVRSVVLTIVARLIDRGKYMRNDVCVLRLLIDNNNGAAHNNRSCQTGRSYRVVIGKAGLGTYALGRSRSLWVAFGRKRAQDVFSFTPQNPCYARVLLKSIWPCDTPNAFEFANDPMVTFFASQKCGLSCPDFQVNFRVFVAFLVGFGSFSEISQIPI